MGNRDGGVFLLKMSKHSLSRLEEVDEGVLPVATAVPATDFADRIDWQSLFSFLLEVLLTDGWKFGRSNQFVA